MKAIVYSFIFLLISLQEIYAQNSWIQTNGPTGGSALCLTINGANLYAGTGNGVFYSSNSGQNWRQTGLHKSISCILVRGNFIIAGLNNHGLFYSTDNGINWTSAGFNNFFVWSLVFKGTKIFAGTSGGVYYSSDNGQSWNITSLMNNQTHALAVNNNDLLAGTSDSGIYISPDEGQSWVHSSFRNQFVVTIEVNLPDIFTVSNGGVYKSTDNGISWNIILSDPVRCLLVNGSNMYAGTYVGNGSGILYSTDYGATWTSNSLNYGQVYSIKLSGSDIITSISYYGLFKSVNNGQNWSSLTFNNQNVWSIGGSGSVIYGGSSTYGLARSTDYGLTWNQTITGSVSIPSIAANGQYVLVSTSGYQGIERSTDYGQTWQLRLNTISFSQLAIRDSFVYAGTSRGILFSSNYGQTWKYTGYREGDIYSFGINGQRIYAGTYSHGIIISNDNGISWTQSLLNTGAVYAIAIKDSNVFAATYNGVKCSTNNGLTWPLNTLNNKWIYSLLMYNNILIAGCHDSGVYVSADFGQNWIQKNEGLGYQVINQLVLVSDYVYLAAQGSSVWKRPASELVGINTTGNSVPEKFLLSQNYPNPFNPVTTIKFALPQTLFNKGLQPLVLLKVYDILGREITTLVNEQLQPGEYSVTWDASNYPSGVYLYKLAYDKNNVAMKMVLLK